MLKILACVFMLIDHIGFVFFPQQVLFRIIGRLAFPIFAHQVSVSFDKTSSRTKYIKRLFIWGVISQVPVMMVFGSSLNILFTFVLAVALLNILEKTKQYILFYRILFGTLAVITILIAAEVLGVDYGWYGVATILLFYVTSNSWVLKYLGFIVLNIVNVIFSIVVFENYGRIIQVFSIVSLALFELDNIKVKLNKYLFYIFYPLHIIIIWIISNFFNL